MITRKLTKDDYKQFSEVSASAYIYNLEETEFEEHVDNFGAFINDGQTLISQLECGSRENYYDNTTLKCAAIGGVASKPEYRRMGGIRAIFEKIEILLKKMLTNVETNDKVYKSSARRQQTKKKFEKQEKSY